MPINFEQYNKDLIAVASTITESISSEDRRQKLSELNKINCSYLETDGITGDEKGRLVKVLVEVRDNYFKKDALPLAKANLQGANLQEAKLQRANLQGANLQEAKLQRANLELATLQRANLELANLRGANLQGAYLQGACLDGITLFGANLQDADLQGAYLQSAGLAGANLQGANLELASLRAAYVEEANLRGANLRGANLQGANPQEANIKDAITIGSSGLSNEQKAQTINTTDQLLTTINSILENPNNITEDTTKTIQNLYKAALEIGTDMWCKDFATRTWVDAIPELKKVADTLKQKYPSFCNNDITKAKQALSPTEGETDYREEPEEKNSNYLALTTLVQVGRDILLPTDVLSTIGKFVFEDSALTKQQDFFLASNIISQPKSAPNAREAIENTVCNTIEKSILERIRAEKQNPQQKGM